MPTDTPPGSDPTPQQFKGHNLTLTTDDDGAPVWATEAGAQFVPYGRFRKILEENKALKENSGKPADTDAIRKQIRGEVEAEYAPRILRAQAENALIRSGLANDEEALDEVMDRYGKARPGDDGKRPDLSAWMAAEVKAGRRWVSMLRDPAPPADAPPAEKPAAPAQVEQPAAPVKPAAPPAPARDVNGGAARPGVPPAPRSRTDRDYQSMSQAEFDRIAREERVAAGLDPDPRAGINRLLGY